VYVKRLSNSTGIWHDGFHLEDYENDPSRPNGCELSKNELQYHSMTRPHERADVIFERREGA
jgi:hypothetical protein